jgi:hypothetical protein
MQLRTSKTLAFLGGVATLALGSSFMLRMSAPKIRQLHGPCAPRMLELEQSVCPPSLSAPRSVELAQLSIHAH